VRQGAPADKLFSCSVAILECFHQEISYICRWQALMFSTPAFMVTSDAKCEKCAEAEIHIAHLIMPLDPQLDCSSYTTVLR